MSRDDDRIDGVLARILEVQGANGSAAVEAILAEHPDLEAPLRARLRVLRMLDALHASRSGAPVAPSVLASLSSTGRGVRPISLPEPPEELAPPVVLPQTPSGQWGRYAVQGEIARGGVGIVFKARDPDLGRDVALKTLREEHVARPDVLQRFVEEAQIGGQLQHPGVVPVYELGLGSDGQPYFAMKLVKGRTLAHVLAERALPSDDRPRLLSVFQAICQTVAYAHERRILHRDLKPSNVMVGSFGEVQVFDWGMAKVMAHGGAADDARTAGVEEPEPASLVRTVRSASGSAPSVEGSVLGTPQYMAPEQARGEVERLDERADVFSLGAILCEILTGKPPYTGTEREVLVAAAQGRLGPALERLAACGADPELVALANRCLAPEQAGRPRDASVLAREITAHLASLEERARKAEVAEGEARVLVAEERRARRLTLSLSAAVLALVLLGGGGWTWIASERRSRAEGVDRQVELALTEATRLRGQAEARGTADALPLWREALAAVRRAEALAVSDDGSQATRDRAAATSADLGEANRRAEAEAGEKRRDAAAAERFDEIRVEAGEAMNWKATSSAYSAAFRDYLGGDVESLGIDEAARRIGASRIRARLVLALSFWLPVRHHAAEPLEELKGLLARVDADPWRSRERRTAGELGPLQALAAEANLDVLDVQDILRLADGLGSAGDAERAAALAFEAWRRHPGDFWACFTCATWNRLRTPPRFPEAIRFYTAALAIRPRSAVTATNVGLAIYRSGDLDGAITLLREAIQLDATYAPAHSNLGVVLAEKGDLEDAIGEQREAIRLDRDFATAHVNLGNVLLRKRESDAAITEYREAIRLDPKSASPHYELGNAFRSRGDRDGAIAEYREAIRLDPKHANAHGNLGLELYRNGDLDGAIRAYREAIRIDRNLASAHGNLGAALYRKNDLDGSIQATREALRLDPKNAGKHSDLGAALCDKGDLDGAMVALKEALRLNPKDSDTHNNLGNVLTDKGELDSAIAAYREAIRWEPTFAEAHRNLATALQRRGLLGASLEAFRRAHELGSQQRHWPFPTAQEVKQAERLVAAAARLPAFARGEATAATAQELLDMGQAGSLTSSYVAASLAWERALAMDPSLGAELAASHRYNAACAASLAGTGKGTDAATLDGAGRARWRWQALEWLRADLDAWKKVTDTKVARATLEHWRRDADLAVLRDETALARASVEDAAACRALWRDVEQTLEKLAAPK